MKHRLVGLAAIVLLAAACTKQSASKPEPSQETSPEKASSQHASPQGARPMPLTPPPGLPAYSFDGIPGWLALTTQPADTRTYGFTPAHPSATAVIMNADAWSESVEEGTTFRLVVKEGNLPLTLSEVSKIPYGCDDIPVAMAAFRTPHDLAEQVAWILPEAMDAARALPIMAGERSATRRTDSLDSLTIALSAAKQGGRLEITRGKELVHERTFEAPKMDDGDGAVDLTNDLQPGAPFPAAAFRLDAETSVVILRALSLESVWFEALLVRDASVTSAGKTSVYLCAN